MTETKGLRRPFAFRRRALQEGIDRLDLMIAHAGQVGLSRHLQVEREVLAKELDTIEELRSPGLVYLDEIEEDAEEAMEEAFRDAIRYSV